jgi:Spy/CpxP family protein refolding chaperone
MKKWHVVILAVLFLGISSIFVFGANPLPMDPARGHHDPEAFNGPMAPEGLPGFFGPASPSGPLRHLDLSKEQLHLINDLINRSRRETRDLRYDLAQKHIEMLKLFTDPKVDDDTLIAREKELSGLHQKLHDKMARIMIEGRKILTPEQLDKLDQIPLQWPGFMDR